MLTHSFRKQPTPSIRSRRPSRHRPIQNMKTSGRHRLLFTVVAYVLLAAQTASANPGDITTYAGGGVGDDGPAIIAILSSPQGVTFDSAGNLFIADTYNSRIRKVDTSGTITTVAGNGTPGDSGDGGPATSALLGYPQDVAIDSAGNLFIASYNRIRKVDTSGTITTVAGDGTYPYSYSGDGGPATGASLGYPEGVAIDPAGNLFIADTYNQRIRKVDTSGTITTVAGGGSNYPGDGGPATSARLNYPRGVAIDPAGNLFIANGGSNSIRKVDTLGTITTVATLAIVSNPRGVAIDSAGNLFITEPYNNRIRKIDSAGTITTVAGNGTLGYSGDGGPATSARLNNPAGVAIDSAGNLFIADTYNHRIRRVDTAGTITSVAGDGTLAGYSGDDGPATSARLNNPKGVAIDPAGNLFIADTYNHRIRKVDTSGTITTLAGNGTPGYTGDGGPATSARLNNPTSVALDSAGNLFIADTYNHRIRKVDTSGTISTVAGNGGQGSSGDGGPATSASMRYPYGVAIDLAGNLFIADTYNHRIRKVDTSGTITTVAGNGTSGYSGDGGPATSARLNYPRGVAIDLAGNLFIADTNNHRIRKVTLGLLITTVAGDGIYSYSGDGGPAIIASLSYPVGVAIDFAGNLFIADTVNQRIRKVTLGLIITTVAGNPCTYGSGSPAPCYSGDGGPATSASLGDPSGVAIDSAGNLFIADTGNSRIRKVAA